MNLLPDLIYPIVWIASPIWLVFLLIYLRRKVARPTVWGFLLEKKESAPSFQQHQWPWMKIFILSIGSLLCFFVISIPNQQQLQLVIDEPSFLSKLSINQKESLEKSLQFDQNPNIDVHAISPKGNFYFKSRDFNNLFNHAFNQKVTDSWYDSQRYSNSSTIDLNTQIAMTQNPLENQNGIYGLVKDGGKLYLGIWSKVLNQSLQISYEDQTLQLDNKPWQYVEVPNGALSKKLKLIPLDDQPLDNAINLSGFENQKLIWQSTKELSQSFRQTLNQQNFWVKPSPLQIYINQPKTFNPNAKGLHFIDQPHSTFSKAIAPDLFKDLYSTNRLALSTRHHSLQWPISKQPSISINKQEQHLSLLFSENHSFATLEQNQIIHSCLKEESLKSNLNQKISDLYLKTLYPTLNDPWLIKRDFLSKRTQLEEMNEIPHQHLNLTMGLSLFLVAILGGGLSTIIKS